MFKAIVALNVAALAQAVEIQTECTAERCPLTGRPELVALQRGPWKKSYRNNLCGLRCENGKCTYRGGLCGTGYGDKAK